MDTPQRCHGIVTSSSYSAGVARSSSRAATGASPPAQYDEALRLGIVEEAMRRLRDGTPEQLGLRPLAASQGTSTTAVYTMFGGKSGLLAAVANKADRSLTEALRWSMCHDSVLSDMRSLCREYRRWALDNQGLYGLVVGERTYSPRVASDLGGPQWREPLLEIVDALVDEGIFWAADVHETANAIWASLHGVVSLELSVWRDSPSAEQYFETQLAAVLRSWTQGESASEFATESSTGSAG